MIRVFKLIRVFELIRVCVRVQQVMGEKAALRARLDNEGQRIEELTAQLARAHPALRGGLSMLESAPRPYRLPFRASSEN